MADRKTFETPLSIADKFYIWHDYIKNGANYDADKAAALQAIFNNNRTYEWTDLTQAKTTYTATDGTTQEIALTFNYDDSYPYGWKLDMDIGPSAQGDDYSILADSATADSITLTTGSGNSQIFMNDTKYDDLLNSLMVSIDAEVATYTSSVVSALYFFNQFSDSIYNDDAFLDAYNSYTDNNKYLYQYLTFYNDSEEHTNKPSSSIKIVDTDVIFKNTDEITYTCYEGESAETNTYTITAINGDTTDTRVGEYSYKAVVEEVDTNKYITDFLPTSSQTDYLIPQGFTLASGEVFKKGETISYTYEEE